MVGNLGTHGHRVAGIIYCSTARACRGSRAEKEVFNMKVISPLQYFCSVVGGAICFGIVVTLLLSFSRFIISGQ